MFKIANSIKPLLIELDIIAPLNGPVKIDTLIELTKKHAQLNEILLSPIALGSIEGMHIHFPDKQLLIIYYRACTVHALDDPTRTCKLCRWARAIIAKELSHAFDDPDHRTTASNVEELVIKESLKGSYGTDHAVSDLFGMLWGTEMLFRYHHRTELTGGGVLAESHRLVSAKATGDYSYFAEQFCIPDVVVKLALGDVALKTMKIVREKVGLPLFRYDDC